MYKDYSYLFLEWVPFDRFTADIEEIGEGGFTKVYSATWIDGYNRYVAVIIDKMMEVWKKISKVALKRLNGSQNISDKYLNKVRFYYF